MKESKGSWCRRFSQPIALVNKLMMDVILIDSEVVDDWKNKEKLKV